MPVNSTTVVAVSIIQIIMHLLQKKKRRRSIGVRPVYQRRRLLGDGHNLLNELRLEDSELFFNYTRMDRKRFEYLLRLVGPIIKSTRKMKTIISPQQRLAMTLRYLAAGDSYGTLSFSYRCARSTVCGIVKKTLRAIVRVLLQKTVILPTSHRQWKEIAKVFWESWNLPLCVGAIDGRHIKVHSPLLSGSAYYNYKSFFSTVLMAVVDAEYAFIAVDVGAEGSQSDSAVFKDSKFGKKFQSKSLLLPPADCLPNTNSKFEYFFVGDGAFQLKPNLMKPYACRKLSEEEAVYNYRISRGRRVVENAFGILVARWRVYERPLNCKLETADYIVFATVCLHNFIMKTRDVKKQDDYIPADFVDVDHGNGNVRGGEWRKIVGDNTVMTDIPRSRCHNAERSAINARVRLTEYFNAEGAVPWQVERVRAGFWGAHIDE